MCLGKSLSSRLQKAVRDASPLLSQSLRTKQRGLLERSFFEDFAFAQVWREVSTSVSHFPAFVAVETCRLPQAHLSAASLTRRRTTSSGTSGSSTIRPSRSSAAASRSSPTPTLPTPLRNGPSPRLWQASAPSSPRRRPTTPTSSAASRRAGGRGPGGAGRGRARVCPHIHHSGATSLPSRRPCSAAG